MSNSEDNGFFCMFVISFFFRKEKMLLSSVMCYSSCSFLPITSARIYMGDTYSRDTSLTGTCIVLSY